jgi:acetoin utilization protein AcuB
VIPSTSRSRGAARDCNPGNIELRIRDVISPTLGVRSDDESAATLEKMRAAGVEYAIVTQGSSIRGVVSEADLTRVCRVHPRTPLAELTREVPVIDAESPIADAANLMRGRKVGCVPVVDDGAIAGVITIEKLLDLIGRGAIQATRRRR